MARQVFYTPSAKATLQSVYSFLTEKFGEPTANEFLSKAEKTILILALQPYIFRRSTIGESVRIAFITKQCSLFYEVKETSITLLFFWDNRQELLTK